MWKGKMRHLEERSLEAERPALGNEKESLLKPWVYNLLVSMCLKIVTNNPEPKFSFKKCDMQIDSSQIYMKSINEHRFFYVLVERKITDFLHWPLSEKSSNITSCAPIALQQPLLLPWACLPLAPSSKELWRWKLFNVFWMEHMQALNLSGILNWLIIR